MSLTHIQVAISLGANPLKLDQYGRTALHCATVNSYQEEAVYFLTIAGLDAINVKDIFGFTPLHYAVLCNNTYAIIFLSRLATSETIQDVIDTLEHNLLIPQDTESLHEILTNLKFL